MATTIEVKQDLALGRSVTIDGVECEVTAMSFTDALSKESRMDEIVELLNDLLDCGGGYHGCDDDIRKLLKKIDG